jgi:hypothetical protein
LSPTARAARLRTEKVEKKLTKQEREAARAKARANSERLLALAEKAQAELDRRKAQSA